MSLVMRPMLLALLLALPACAPVDAGPIADDPVAPGPLLAEPPAPAVHVLGDDPTGALQRSRPATPAPLPPAQIVLSARWTEAEPVEATSSFPLYATPDLVLYLYFNGLADNDYLVWLEYVSPAGTVYQRDPIAFQVGDDPSAGTLAVPELWTPVQVRPALSTALGWRVTEVLPLDGSDVVRHALAGDWTVRLYFETPTGQPVATTRFTLVE